MRNPIARGFVALIAASTAFAWPSTPRSDSAPRVESTNGLSGAQIVEHVDPSEARYILRDGRTTAFFGETGMTLSTLGSDGGWALRWGIDGASAVEPSPQGEQATRVSTFLGNDPSRWQRGLPTWSGLSYAGV